MNEQDAAVEAVMVQAQKFASYWALIGNRFGGPHPLRDAQAEKEKLRAMIVALVSAQPSAQ